MSPSARDPGSGKHPSGSEPAAREDPYSRVDYRRLIAWPERLRREAPFLLRTLEQAPERSVLDLGCGTGEHARFLASQGFRTVGLDRAAAMLEKAREEPIPENLRVLEGDIREADQLLQESFGAAISLGNTLVHLKDEGEMSQGLAAVARRLLPGGILLFQILNYERIFARGIRYLPLNFRPDEKGEIVFLRLTEHLDGKRVRFCPSTLLYNPDEDPPLQIVQSKIVEIRGWTLQDLEPLLAANGFRVVGVYGDMAGGEYVPQESHDLVVVAAKT